MEDDLKKTNNKLFSYSEEFEKLCPYFMAIGMSYDQFWYGNCWVANAYLRSYEIRRKQKNEELWLQGVYIYEALCDVSPVLHAFAKKGTKPRPYPKEPFSLFKKEKEEEQYTEEQNEKERYKAEMFFKEWARQFKNRQKNKNNKGE